MSYIRPPLHLDVFRDSDGAVIEYGNRWGLHGMPAEWSYSIEPHPERFEPLLVVADALIEYLAATYAVTVTRNGNTTELTPQAGAASLRFEVTRKRPTVELRAGATRDFRFPFCGCDACDDDVLELIDELEGTSLAVAEGRYRERLSGREVTARVTDEDGYSETATRLDRKERKRVKGLLPPNGYWAPWVAR